MIVLHDKSVAAHHARIERTHDRYRLVDLGGGIQIGADTYYRVELIDGDDVQIGAGRLRFKAP